MLKEVPEVQAKIEEPLKIKVYPNPPANKAVLKYHLIGYLSEYLQIPIEASKHILEHVENQLTVNRDQSKPDRLIINF